MKLVLDASVTLSWLFEDEASEATDAILAGLENGEAFVPSLWRYEVANVLLVAERRARISQAQSQRFTTLLAKLPITVVAPSGTQLWSEVMAIARGHQLSAYDAAYLELALRRDVPLASKDKALRKAAESIGVALA